MKKQIYISNNEKMSTEYRNIIENTNITKENNIFKKEEIEQILTNHKSSLTKLFSTLKNFQNDYFSKETNTNKINLLKKSLTKLHSNLTSIKKEKMKQLHILETTNENEKSTIQKSLFPDNENNTNDTDDLYTSFIRQKNDLKALNFKIQNEIEKTRIIIEIKNKIYSYIKHIPFYLNLNRDIYCKINKEDTEKVSEILKNIRNSVKNTFISTVKEKMETDLEINSVKFKIKLIKDNITNNKLDGNKRYIEPEEIIYEETKENNQSITNEKNKRSSCASINKITFSKNVLKRPSNNLAKRHLSIDAVMEDNFYRNKLFNLFLKNNEIMGNNKNQINNFVNINVNINLGYNKHNCSTSSLENEDDNDSKDDQAKIELDESNSINESSNQTGEKINDNNFY
jgi:hypothetical protein